MSRTIEDITQEAAHNIIDDMHDAHGQNVPMLIQRACEEAVGDAKLKARIDILTDVAQERDNLFSENATLKARLAEARAQALADRAFQTENAKLRAQLAEAQADSRRLDRIERERWIVSSWGKEGSRDVEWWIEKDTPKETILISAKKSLRAAIDNAERAEGEER